MNIWIISIFWLLWIMLLYTFMFKFLWGHMFSFIMDIYLGVELLGHMVILCLIVWATARLFSKVALPSSISIQQCESSNFPTPSSTLTWRFDSSHPASGKWYLTVILIKFLRWLIITSIFSCAFWWFVYLPWRYACLDPLPVFKLGYLSFYYCIVRVLYIS